MLLQIADKLEVFPGSEFRTAYVEAMAYGAKVILGDRPVQVRVLKCAEQLFYQLVSNFNIFHMMVFDCLIKICLCFDL